MFVVRARAGACLNGSGELDLTEEQQINNRSQSGSKRRKRYDCSCEPLRALGLMSEAQWVGRRTLCSASSGCDGSPGSCGTFKNMQNISTLKKKPSRFFRNHFFYPCALPGGGVYLCACGCMGQFKTSTPQVLPNKQRHFPSVLGTFFSSCPPGVAISTFPFLLYPPGVAISPVHFF